MPVFDDLLEPYAKCISLHAVKTTDQTWFYSGEESVVPTCFAADQGSFCYYFTSENLEFGNNPDVVKTRCHCGMDNSIGYCPLPDTKT